MENRVNNFDLLRLLAAFQVLILHAKGHLKVSNDFIELFSDNILSFFPGVPIFFYISGFLIYSSFERNKGTIKRYFANRCLRVFPALWICFLVTLSLLLYDWPGSVVDFFSTEFFLWILGQLTLFQFYTPDFLRFWGVGTPNGSLWTITVEVQFYLAVPVIFYIFKRAGQYLLPIAVLFGIAIVANHLIGNAVVEESIYGKLGGVTLLPYLYYFLIGILVKLMWSHIERFMKNKFLIWIVVYGSLAWSLAYFFNAEFTSYYIFSPVKILMDLLLAAVVFSFAYSFSTLSGSLLKGNDISYGLYIYHMVVVNFMVHRGYMYDVKFLAIAIVATIILAVCSWRFIEKPSLKLKHVFKNI